MEPIRISATRHAFQAWRDKAGVPHVQAEDWSGALYALGYLHASDRPTQMQFARAVASGRASELIAAKPQLLETDRFFRRAGLARMVDAEFARLDPLHRSLLQVYCDGVNDSLAESGRSFPMWITGFRPEPWDPRAVMLIGNLLSFAGLAVGTQENERLLLELIQLGIDDDLIRELFEPHLNEVDLELMRSVKISRQLSDEALELLADLPRLAGSNAWAVAPSRSQTGFPLLAGDPHLEINRLPAIWYEVVLRWGENDYLMGASLPGCPLFSVARNRQLAWSVTYLRGDTSDHFIEDCRCGDNGAWQYRRGEQWHEFAVRTEVIRQKGQEPLKISIFENPQGIMEDDLSDCDPGHYLSVAWIGEEPGAGRSIATWLEIAQAANATEGMDIVRESPHPSLVWIFADREGHIGRQASGWFPRRSEVHSGLVPMPAWDVRNHWIGRIDTRALPRVYDPPEGYISTANESINQPFGPHFSTHPLPDYRKRRIDEVLARYDLATIEQMQALQYDVLSLHAREMLPGFLQHLPDSDFRRRLTAWDYRYTPESREATMFLNFYRHVLLEVFGHERGIGWQRMIYLSTRLGYSLMLLTCADRILRKDQSGWWRGRDKGDLIREAAARAAAVADRPWAETNAFHFTNRFVEGGRVGRLLGFKSAEVPLPGCHATPFQGHLLQTARRESTFAPSYHFVTDLGVDEAWTNLPGGPSESRLSKWYDSDIARWREGDYKQLIVNAASISTDADEKV